MMVDEANDISRCQTTLYRLTDTNAGAGSGKKTSKRRTRTA